MLWLQNIILCLVFWLFVFVRPVQAYLDPGTGSYVTQIIIGVLAGGGYAIKLNWQKIVSFIKKTLSKIKPKNEGKK